MTPTPKTQQISITPDERDQLKELRNLLDMTMSAIIRAAIHDFYQKVTAEPKPEEETK